MDVLEALLLEILARLATLDPANDRCEVLAVWAELRRDLVERLHAKGGAQRLDGLGVVGIGVVDHLEPVLAEP